MAKVSDIKFEIKGEHFTVHVNCNSAGEFSANLPEKVSSALNLQQKLRTTTLQALETDFQAAIDRYKKAETKQELFIAIKYLSSGRFSEKENGDPLFGGYDNKYQLQLQWHSGSIDAIAFHFEVVMKETVDTIEKWFSTQLGRDFPYWDKEQNENPDKYYKQNSEFRSHQLNKWKFIPFTQQALDTLKIAQDKIRTVSEMLFNFIEQDEEQIALTLTKNKLLVNKF